MLTPTLLFSNDDPVYLSLMHELLVEAGYTHVITAQLVSLIPHEVAEFPRYQPPHQLTIRGSRGGHHVGSQARDKGLISSA